MESWAGNDTKVYTRECQRLGEVALHISGHDLEESDVVNTEGNMALALSVSGRELGVPLEHPSRQ